MNTVIAANDSMPLRTGHVPRKHVAITTCIAVALHIAALLLWAVNYDPLPEVIEVKVMNLKLGGGGEIFVEKPGNSVAVQSQRSSRATNNVNVRPADARAQAATASTQSNNAVAKPAREIPAIRPIPKPAAPVATPIMDQEVRTPVAQQARAKAPAESNQAEPATPSVQAVRSPGTPTSKKLKIRQIMERYEQLLSGWIKTHKIYPEALKEKGVEGIGAVRIRINRKGRILHTRIEQATGQTLLDKAMIDMIERSNPVPAVPENLEGEAFEFIVPITFFATSEE